MREVVCPHDSECNFRGVDDGVGNNVSWYIRVLCLRGVSDEWKNWSVVDSRHGRVSLVDLTFSFICRANVLVVRG